MCESRKGNVHPVDFGDIEVPKDCTFECRPAKAGERAYNGNAWVTTLADIPLKLIVAVPNWTPPEFLKPGWVAMDANGAWRWHEKEPHPRQNYYEWDSAGACVFLGHFIWTPPVCADWTQSKRRVP